MSYPIDLFEFSDDALLSEILRRAHEHRRGLCTYCGRRRGVRPACRFSDRHRKRAKPSALMLAFAGNPKDQEGEVGE